MAAEDMNAKDLAAGRRAKSVHDAGWSALLAKIAYKAEHTGRQLMLVDPAGTSQRCICGARVKKQLSDRMHVCPECGLIGERDLISAMEILRLGLSLQTASTRNQALLV